MSPNTTRRTILRTIGGLAGAAALGTPVAADHESEAGGRDPASRGELGSGLIGAGASDLLTNEELGELLYELEDETDAVSVDVLGETREGREIYSANAGSGETAVLAMAEQHGHEPFQAEGCLAALNYLGNADHRTVEGLREAVTLHVVPRVNPDGLARRHRTNYDPDAPDSDPEEGIHTREDGWDPNRYHRYDWEESTLYGSHPDEYSENPVPEARNVVELAREIDPEWVLDCHRQGAHVDSNGDLIDVSLGWPQNPDVPDDAQELSQQVAATLYDRLPEVEDRECNVTEFTPAGEYPGIARNAHALAGNGSVLLEMSTATRGGIGYRIGTTAEAILLLVEATADGSLHEADPDRVDEIPAEWGTTMNL